MIQAILNFITNRPLPVAWGGTSFSVIATTVSIVEQAMPILSCIAVLLAIVSSVLASLVSYRALKSKPKEVKKSNG